MRSTGRSRVSVRRAKRRTTARTLDVPIDLARRQAASPAPIAPMRCPLVCPSIDALRLAPVDPLPRGASHTAVGFPRVRLALPLRRRRLGADAALSRRRGWIDRRDRSHPGRRFGDAAAHGRRHELGPFRVDSGDLPSLTVRQFGGPGRFDKGRRIGKLLQRHRHLVPCFRTYASLRVCERSPLPQTRGLGAACGNAACTDLRGGRRATGVGTTTGKNALCCTVILRPLWLWPKAALGTLMIP